MQFFFNIIYVVIFWWWILSLLFNILSWIFLISIIFSPLSKIFFQVWNMLLMPYWKKVIKRVKLEKKFNLYYLLINILRFPFGFIFMIFLYIFSIFYFITVLYIPVSNLYASLAKHILFPFDIEIINVDEIDNLEEKYVENLNEKTNKKIENELNWYVNIANKTSITSYQEQNLMNDLISWIYWDVIEYEKENEKIILSNRKIKNKLIDIIWIWIILYTCYWLYNNYNFLNNYFNIPVQINKIKLVKEITINNINIKLDKIENWYKYLYFKYWELKNEKNKNIMFNVNEAKWFSVSFIKNDEQFYSLKSWNLKLEQIQKWEYYLWKPLKDFIINVRWNSYENLSWLINNKKMNSSLYDLLLILYFNNEITYNNKYLYENIIILWSYNDVQQILNSHYLKLKKDIFNFKLKKTL